MIIIEFLVTIINMSVKDKWIEPLIKELGDILELTQGGEGGDPKFLGTGDALQLMI